MSIDYFPATTHDTVTPKRINELQSRWDRSLLYLAHTLFREDRRRTPIDTLTQVSQEQFIRDPCAKPLIGIAGLGTAGNETLGQFFTETLGYEKIIPTAPPKAREGEIGGYVFEEDTTTIIEMLDAVTDPGVQRILLYILPAHPVMTSAVKHLTHRLSLEPDPAKQLLTPDIFESALGDQQIDEFLELGKLAQHPGIQPVFVANEDVEATKLTLAELFGK